MPTESADTPVVSPKFGSDFWKFWIGQSISNIGSAFTTFALPLLIFKITNSALNLALASALTFLPYLLFGLIIGAWVDRTNRKRLMIITDVLRGLLIGSIGILAMINALPLWLIYVNIFLLSTLGIGFTSAQLAAVPNLVDSSNMIKANGRFQASYSASLIIGPSLAGLLISLMDVPMLMFVDMFSFLFSAVSLLFIKASFNANTRPTSTSLRQDVVEGLRYVLTHPVLRPLSLMTALFVFIDATTNAQLVLFAKERFQVSDSAVGLMYTAGGIGFFVFSLLVTQVRKHWSFSKVVLTTGLLKGIILATLGLTQWYWAALILWGLSEGITMLYTINSLSLRQIIVPGHLLGRVISLAGVLAWSAIPLGTFLGGIAIEQTNNVALVYTIIGVIHVCVAIPFFFSRLSQAEQYIPTEVPATELASA
jgi:MFS family permease